MMDEHIFFEFPQDFIEPLLKICEAPAPPAAFVADLEQKLLKRQAVLLGSSLATSHTIHQPWTRLSSFFTRRNLQYAVLVLLAALAITLFAIGPQRVLAQVQHWLGYVPGIGFVNLAETRVLPGPVEVTQAGTVLRVEQVIAGPQRTEVLISSPGLSGQDLPWPNPAVQNPDFTAYLRLPDGSQLEATRWQLNLGSGKLEFPALPPGVHQVTLLMPRLPLVPPGALPENWEVTLPLRPVTGELSQALFPQPYNLPDASDSHHGVILRVLDVAQTASQTALHYQLEWTDPSWEHRFGLGALRSPELHDDLGHFYWESPAADGSSVSVVAVPASNNAQPTPSVPGDTGDLVFPALSLSASQATLWVADLQFAVPATGTLPIDLGDNPQIGDKIPLDLHLDVAGFPVHIRGAHLAQETVEMGDGKQKQRPILEFQLDPSQERNGFSLFRFDLSNREQGVFGAAGLSFNNGEKVYEGRLEFTNGTIPSGKIELQVINAELLVQGPWEVTWTIPGKDPANPGSPFRLYPDRNVEPAGAGQSSGEIRPVIEEAFLSDRLTALKLGVLGLPPNASFVQALAYDPATYDPYRPKIDFYLEDNWGRRYDPGRNEAFLRPQGDGTTLDLSWRYFPPLQPLAQSLTLHVPGMEVFLPGQASFEIQVPQEVSFHPEEMAVTVFVGGAKRQVTQTRWLSDPWPVEISFELSGYKLQLTQAQLEHDTRGDPAYRLILTGEPPSITTEGHHLNTLRFSGFTPPGGEPVLLDPALVNSGQVAYPNGAVWPVEPGSSEMKLTAILDVTGDYPDELRTGRYRVALSGVTEWVPGPWDLHISLSGNE